MCLFPSLFVCLFRFSRAIGIVELELSNALNHADGYVCFANVEQLTFSNANKINIVECQKESNGFCTSAHTHTNTHTLTIAPSKCLAILGPVSFYLAWSYRRAAVRKLTYTFL